jgi:cytochrome c-type biogenesis protein CcmH
MLLWVLLAVMTGAVVTAVLWPLSKPATDPTLDGDVDFYKAQLAEIDRDRARGLIAENEAEAARTESGRRLLRATATIRESADATSEPALRRRRAASAMALCVVPIVGLGLYGGYGSPELQGQAVAAAPEIPDTQPRFEAALKRVEDHLAANPADARGWDVIAPIYLRVGRYGDALNAFSRARETGGDNASRLLGEAEARIALGQGTITAEARGLLEAVVQREPASVPARYYLALAREQAGDRDGARAAYRALIAEANSEAPWLPLLQTRLARLDHPGGVASVPTIPAVSVTPEIDAMVGGLDERLRTSGGSEAEWARLVRSLAVLGRRDEANDRLAKAKVALAGDPGAPARLDRLAGDLGLRGGAR